MFLAKRKFGLPSAWQTLHGPASCLEKSHSSPLARGWLTGWALGQLGWFVDSPISLFPLFPPLEASETIFKSGEER